ncbi:hypothetical protein NE237_009139 [Protea cynaroides]|uniref:Uncharacterized protein n=1 Tax=Protea cynaroides TaxID=273540 RepID=A0A9Q0R0C8_9MAGN|nr:hypothetical protein NE237_009139 [Protea cynaroides]
MRAIIENLVTTLQLSSVNEDENIKDLQNLILKSKVFSRLESVLLLAIDTLVRFNKDMFVDQVLMSLTIRALISMASNSSIQVLSNGEIPKLLNFLNIEDWSLRIAAMDSIKVMPEEDLIKKLVELQMSELRGDLIEMDRFSENETSGVCVGGVEMESKGRKEKKEMRFLESHPFASCVARFSVHLDVGEGFRQRERRAFKQEMLKKVKEACVSDAEAATIVTT